MAKARLDSRVFELGLTESRERAKALIMAGQVYVNGTKALKAGDCIDEKDIVEVRGDRLPFVSRGGLKLQKAVECFDLCMEGLVCADIGASTGGFTDCMLQHGAAKVYAVDVGYGQLAWKLRTDNRVINLERTNFRHITPEQIPESIEFASCDVSFISLKHIFPALHGIVSPTAHAVCLVKPQFEAGREKVGKKGVVRDESVHIEVVENTAAYAKDNGFRILGLDFSPIRGPEGNIEYLLYLGVSEDEPEKEIDIPGVVAASHSKLNGGE